MEELHLLFFYLRKVEYHLANQVAMKIHQLFRARKQTNYHKLYFYFKSIYIKEISFFSKFDPVIKVSLLCIASMNGDGHIRGKAVNRLIDLRTKDAIPFLLFRLADWVSSIQTLI